MKNSARSSSSPEDGSPASRDAADYDRLFNLSLDLLCIAGLDGYFKRVNPSWTRVMGWSEAELLAHPVEYFMHPEDRARTLAARASLAEGKPVRGLENRYLCKDGSYRWLSWQSVVEPGAATVFAIARDITERRLLEDERLVLSKLESTGILAGGIAHDFNNLLATLLLNVEMIGLCEATTAQQEFHIQQAKQTIDAARALTQQFIAFADGGIPSRRISDVRAPVREAFGIALSGSALRGECEIASDLWPVEVDETQFGQLIRSLALNAREASAPGSRVRLFARNFIADEKSVPDLPAGDYVRFQIVDEGAGIPGSILPKIFDPYFSTKQRGNQKGMGLGLSICRTIVQKHHGRIAVESLPGHGTIVTFYLPASSRTSARHHPESPARVSKPRILVMDDEQLFRDALEMALRQLGYDVQAVADGAQAVVAYREAAAAGRPFDALMLDLTVRGGLGGADALRQLRAGDASVRAILMSGYTQESAFRDYRSLGFSGALAKPFSADALQQALTAMLPSR